MSIQVSYLPEEEIEAAAKALLVEQESRTDKPVAGPVDLDDLLVQLGLALDLDDLCGMLGHPDILGAIWIDKKAIYIDQSLDPDEHPAMLGRYRFSLAHEIGHWRLHGHYFHLRARHADLFGEQPSPSIVCRTSQQKTRIELQADAFAACLLMPRNAVIREWQRLIGPERLKLSSLREKRSQYLRAVAFWRGRINVGGREQDNDMIEFAIRPLAEAFQVSPQAMRIRLERLNLVVRDVDETVEMFGAA